MLPEIMRRLNHIFAKLNSIDDRLCKIEENQKNSIQDKEMSFLRFKNLLLCP